MFDRQALICDMTALAAMPGVSIDVRYTLVRTVMMVIASFAIPLGCRPTSYHAHTNECLQMRLLSRISARSPNILTFCNHLQTMASSQKGRFQPLPQYDEELDEHVRPRRPSSKRYWWIVVLWPLSILVTAVLCRHFFTYSPVDLIAGLNTYCQYRDGGRLSSY